jgi:hypothetical protein
MAIGFYTTLGLTIASGIALITLGTIALQWSKEFQGLTRDNPQAESLSNRGPNMVIATDVMIGVTGASAAAALVLGLLAFVDWGGETTAALPISWPGWLGLAGRF